MFVGLGMPWFYEGEGDSCAGLRFKNRIAHLDDLILMRLTTSSQAEHLWPREIYINDYFDILPQLETYSLDIYFYLLDFSRSRLRKMWEDKHTLVFSKRCERVSFEFGDDGMRIAFVPLYVRRCLTCVHQMKRKKKQTYRQIILLSYLLCWTDNGSCCIH